MHVSILEVIGICSWTLELERLSSISYISYLSFNLYFLNCGWITWIDVELQCIAWISAELRLHYLNCGCITWIAVESHWIAMQLCISVQQNFPLEFIDSGSKEIVYIFFMERLRKKKSYFLHSEVSWGLQGRWLSMLSKFFSFILMWIFYFA
jgi:hypothetical protein